MTPPAIVQAARAAGLALIAVCDHNAAGNTAACVAAGGGELVVIAGMEITTLEEVHVVGLFPTPRQAEAAAGEVQATLPRADAAYYARFGAQLLMDAKGAVRGEEAKMLALATALELSDAVALVHRHAGLALAAHINRPSFSVLSQLGVFPREAGLDGIEVFTPCTGGAAVVDRARAAEFAEYGLPVVASSDAHYLGDVGRAQTVLTAEAATFAELVLALRSVGGRGVRSA